VLFEKLADLRAGEVIDHDLEFARLHDKLTLPTRLLHGYARSRS
jgi:hypothetical protein